VRDINKLSNNVMARQVYLTLATASSPPPATLEKAHDALSRWLAQRKLALPELVVENGSGLSRNDRITPRTLATLLRTAWSSGSMPEITSSLPIYAVDGTLKLRKPGTVAGQAHLKGGTLTGVQSMAGYVLDARGRRWVVVMILNHPNANAAQPALDALVEWVYRLPGGKAP